MDAVTNPKEYWVLERCAFLWNVVDALPTHEISERKLVKLIYLLECAGVKTPYHRSVDFHLSMYNVQSYAVVQDMSHAVTMGFFTVKEWTVTTLPQQEQYIPPLSNKDRSLVQRLSSETYETLREAARILYYGYIDTFARKEALQTCSLEAKKLAEELDGVTV